MYRFGAAVLISAIIIPVLRGTGTFARSATVPLSVRQKTDLSKRDSSPTDVCFRWAQQSAIVNGTLYLYGGQSSSQPGQTENTWNNDLLTLDLAKTWQIASPSLSGLPQPSGPPAVSLGYLWNSRESLYLYGGESSWKPAVSPTPFSLWEYDIVAQSWKEHSNPTTSSGNSAPSNNDPVQRAAEGAGLGVPSLGRGFYFGGHLDGYTTAGWSQSVPRIYLQSLLEYTYPGYANDQVSALSNGKPAGSDGAYRNITRGGLQDTAGFTQRADGLLLYVPGFGDEGILLAIAGGSSATFTQMNNVDVYDIAKSTWYKQSAAGPTPTIRVNPCAVVAAAADGSSYNIYMYGGQALQPAGTQTQYNDMWILTLPSFTWIQVDQSGQSVPYGRSGHTCNIWDGQIVMVGGYVGDQLSCESPGIYVYDLSNLQWVRQFTALSSGPYTPGSSSHAADAKSASGSGFVSTGSNNPFNQQMAQMANDSGPGGLEGSYGYQVPRAVIAIVGGNAAGGATVTAPVATASVGPLATGKPLTYSVAGPDTITGPSNVTGMTSPTVTETPTPGSNATRPISGNSGPNVAAIVVGVICGILFIIACYLAFCAYIYRRQLQLYKQHVDMASRQARGEKTSAIPGLLGTTVAAKTSVDRRDDRSGGLVESASPTDSSSVGRSGDSAGQVSTGYQSLGRSSEHSSVEDLISGQEPTFVGVMLNPRRTLRVMNRD